MINETTASILYPMIIIEHDGKRRYTNGREAMPEGTGVTSEYHDWNKRRKGKGPRAFRIITRKET